GRVRERRARRGDHDRAVEAGRAGVLAAEVRHLGGTELAGVREEAVVPRLARADGLVRAVADRDAGVAGAPQELVRVERGPGRRALVGEVDHDALAGR